MATISLQGDRTPETMADVPPTEFGRYEKLALPRSVLYTLFVCLNVAIYTNLPIRIGLLNVEGGVALIPSLIFFIVIARRLSAAKVLFIVALATVPLIPTLLNILRGLSVTEGLQAYAGLAASIIAAIGCAEVVKRLRSDTVSLLLLVLCALVISAIIIELYVPQFADLSNSAREWLYQGRFIYDSDARDLALYGHIRPKAFSQEPSFPARYLSYALVCVFMLSTNLRKKLVALAIFALTLVVISSPTVYIAVVLFLYALLISYLRNHPTMRLPISLGLLGICIGSVAVMSNIPTLAVLMGENRAARISQGQDASTNMRLLIPPRIALAVMSQLGPFGSGMGSKEYIQDVVSPIYTEYANSKYMVDSNGNYLWTNAFYDMIIYLGPIFSLLFLFFMPFVFNSPVFSGVFLCYIAVFALNGGFSAPYNWAYFALIISSLSMEERRFYNRR